MFKEKFSGWDKIERRVLDANKRAQREKFNECVDQKLEISH